MKFKNLVCLLITLTAYSAGSFADAFKHPLDPTLRGLLEASAAAQRAANSVPDSDVKEEASRMQARISDLGLDALIAPVRVSERKLGRLGFEVAPSDGTGVNYTTKDNANRPKLNSEAMSLQKENWVKVFNLTTQERSDLQSIDDLAKQDYRDLLLPKQREILEGQINMSRAEALRRVRDLAARTVDCIQYFTQAYASSGLRPLYEVGVYSWSLPEMKAQYGVGNLADLSAEQKTKVAGVLQELSAQANRYQFTCVSIPTVRFFLEQKKVLAQQ